IFKSSRAGGCPLGVDGATLSPPLATGTIRMNAKEFISTPAGSENVDFPPSIVILAAQNFTGTMSVTANLEAIEISSTNDVDSAFILLEGTVDVTGTVTLGGTSSKALKGGRSIACGVLLRSRVTSGSVTISGGTITSSYNNWLAIRFEKTQNSGTPAVTISSSIVCEFVIQ